MPPSKVARLQAPNLNFVPVDHYTDAAWDNARMNNIAQHTAAGWRLDQRKP